MFTKLFYFSRIFTRYVNNLLHSRFILIFQANTLYLGTLGKFLGRYIVMSLLVLKNSEQSPF